MWAEGGIWWGGGWAEGQNSVAVSAWETLTGRYWCACKR